MSSTYIVIGLGFGDEGKGTVVDYLAREHNAHTVVRFNGGAQAAHNVVTPDGQHHTFAQFGSGTLAGARTHLSRYMLFNPFDIINEAQGLQKLGISDPLSLLTISPDALVTTPLHIAANQIREEQRAGKHGTCGKGIGETQETANILGDMAIRTGDLIFQGIVEAKLAALQQHYSTTLLETFAKEHGPIDKIARSYRNLAQKFKLRDDADIVTLSWTGHVVIYEGAQGILLDQDVGFHPHTTWSNTTSQNAREILGDTEYTVIGVTRPYTTRHGAGPLITGDFTQPFAEPHNADVGFQGTFRFGAWDAIAMDYAAKCDPVDSVAVTCLDHLSDDWTTIWSYEYRGSMPDLAPYFWIEDKRIFQIVGSDKRAHMEAVTTRLKDCAGNVNHHGRVDADYVIDAIGEVLHAPVTLQSFGPTHKDKRAQVLAWTDHA